MDTLNMIKIPYKVKLWGSSYNSWEYSYEATVTSLTEKEAVTETVTKAREAHPNVKDWNLYSVEEL